MLLRKTALALILGGWCAYFFAWFSPAIELLQGAPDGFYWKTLTGGGCFKYTLIPVNWIFAPLLACYLIVNLLILGVPFLLLVATVPSESKAGRTIPFLWGTCLISCFPLCLVSPWCSSEIHHAYYGCYLWMASVGMTGIGFIVFSLQLNQPGDKSPRAEISNHGLVSLGLPM